MHLDISRTKAFYSPTDTQVNCLKNNIKIYSKIAPTCFGAVTPSSGSALFVLAKALARTNNALPDDGVTAPKHVGAILL